MIAQLQPDADTTDVDLSSWVPASFITQSYKLWWEEWKEHLFTVSGHMYQNMIDPEHDILDDVVSFFPILSVFINFNFIGNLLLYFNMSMTQHQQ